MAKAIQMKTVSFTSDGEDIYLPIGFVPIYFELIELANTNANITKWTRLMAEDAASGKQAGIYMTGSSGVLTYLADGSGIAAYNTAAQLPSVAEWTSTLSTNATARTATARGTLLKATIGAVDQDGAVVDRSAIFECTTQGTSLGTEPTWNTNPDGITFDSDVQFQIVSEALGRIGYQGVFIDGDIQNNSVVYIATAWDCLEDTLGAVDGWTGGVKGA